MSTLVKYIPIRNICLYSGKEMHKIMRHQPVKMKSMMRMRSLIRQKRKYQHLKSKKSLFKTQKSPRLCKIRLSNQISKIYAQMAVTKIQLLKRRHYLLKKKGNLISYQILKKSHAIYLLSNNSLCFQMKFKITFYIQIESRCL